MLGDLRVSPERNSEQKTLSPFFSYVKTMQNNDYRENMVKRKGRDLEFFCEGSHTGYLLGQLMTMEKEFQTCGSPLGKPSAPLHTHTYPLCASVKRASG